MTKREKMNNQATQTTRTRQSEQVFDVSRLTREYFYPDIVNGDLEEIKIPTVRDLTFIGALNIDNLRSDFRREEDKLTLMQDALRHEITSFDEHVKALQTNPGCDWRGYGYGDDENYRAGLIDTCRFGRFTTNWCERIPCSHCDHNCHEMEAAPIDFGQIGDPASLERISTTAVLCQFYDMCRGCRPFIDEPCILLNPEKQAECKAFLKEKLDEISKRRKIMEKYMHNLTQASKKADKRLERPEFFEHDNYVGSTNLNMVVIIKRVENGIGYIVGFRLPAAPAPNGQTPKLFLNKLSDGWEKKEVTDAEVNEIYLSSRDFLYLLKHKDFRQVWLEMSNFWSKAFTKEELAEFFAQYDDVKWPNSSASEQERKGFQDFLNGLKF